MDLLSSKWIQIELQWQYFTNDDVRKPSNEKESFQDISKRQNIGNPVAYFIKINFKKIKECKIEYMPLKVIIPCCM